MNTQYHISICAILHIPFPDFLGIKHKKQIAGEKMGRISSPSSFLFAFLCLVGFLEFSGAAELVCPNPNRILPCTCGFSDEFSKNYSEPILTCEGAFVQQEDVNRLFSLIRTVNNLDTTDYVNISTFELKYTYLLEFDLEPLLNLRTTLDYGIKIYFNSNLTTITGPPQKSQSIQTEILYLRYNNLSDSGLGQSLNHFDPSTLKWLDLYDNALRVASDNVIDDGSGDIELLAGLSTLKNLQTLYLRNNRISRLAGGQFKRNWNLEEIQLRNNDIVEIGEDAFLIGDPSNNRNLTIHLDGNLLTARSFNNKSGLVNGNRRTDLYLQENYIQTIDQGIFEPFLDAHPDNSVDFEENPLTCDGNVAWLKKRRAEFEHRVLNTVCRNDPGHSVFNSALVDIHS